MEILSVNSAVPTELRVGNRTVTTGIFKTPQQGPVCIGTMGVQGDTIINKNVHGGEDQAVYLYSAADYVWWSEQLGR